MRLTVDGYVFEQQSRGGISRLYHEVLPRLCALDDGLAVTLVTCGRVLQYLPQHAHIAHRALWPVGALMQPERIWAPLIAPGRRLVQGCALGAERGTTWLSTYYTSPPDAWRGTRVAVVYDLIPEQFQEQYRSLHAARLRAEKRRAVQQADVVLCISEATRQALLEVIPIPPGRTRVVHLSAGAQFGAGRCAPLRDERYLLYVGERGGYKGFDLLLQALADWPGDCGTRPNLVAVGRAWSREESRRIASLGLAGRVSARTGVDDAALAGLYRGAAALVYPSLAEGFGIPLLEAMACGCPVVASRIPASVEAAGEVPIYCAPGDAGSLALALARALHEGHDPGRLAAGRERAARYTWDDTARSILEVLRALT